MTDAAGPAVLLAGATGQLGRHVAAALHREGYRVHALVRRPELPAALAPLVHRVVVGDLARPATLRGACDGVDVVLSCAGASMKLAGLRDRSSFTRVDAEGNRSLLGEAGRAGVGKMVYVSLFGGRELMHTGYAAAHERVVDALAASAVPHAVIRPTGYFSFFAEVLRMARRGRGMVIGDGGTRTNPVHEADVAEACVAAVRGEAREIAVGGPDTFTRREIVELAFDVLGRPPRIVQAPPALLRAVTVLLRPVNPRIHALMEFGIAVSLMDAVAPAVGRRGLREYFAALAAG